jgi:hypothetical protein
MSAGGGCKGGLARRPEPPRTRPSAASLGRAQHLDDGVRWMLSAKMIPAGRGAIELADMPQADRRTLSERVHNGLGGIEGLRHCPYPSAIGVDGPIQPAAFTSEQLGILLTSHAESSAPYGRTLPAVSSCTPV